MASRLPPPAAPSERGLERALLFNFGIHAVALVGMVTLLLPTLPGGSNAIDAARIAAIAEHPWRFRLGWLPWQRTADWAECWLDFRAFLAYCVPQDRAMASQELRRRTVRQEIDLGIALGACEPLTGHVSSKAARAWVGDAAPLCFRVAALNFAFNGELYDAWD